MSEIGQNISTVLNDTVWPANITGFNTPNVLKDSLKNDDKISIKEQRHLCDPIAEYINDTRNINEPNGYRKSAIKSLNIILNNVNSPINCPEFLGLINNSSINNSLIRRHLDEFFPISLDKLVEKNKIRIDFIENEKNIDNRPIVYSIYNLLSKGPPYSNVYNRIEELNDIFGDVDGKIPWPGVDYNTKEWLYNISRRTVLAYSRDKKLVDDDIVESAIKSMKYSDMDEIILNIDRMCNTRPFEILKKRIINKSNRSSIGSKKLVKNREINTNNNEFLMDIIILRYLSNKKYKIRSSLYGLIKDCLDNNLNVKNKSKICKLLENEVFSDKIESYSKTGNILIKLVDDDTVNNIDIQSHIEFVEKRALPNSSITISDSRSDGIDRVSIHLKILRKAIKSKPECVINNESHVKSLIDLTRKTKYNRIRSIGSDIISVLVEAEKSFLDDCNIFISEIDDVKSSSELDCYGKILKSLDVYPSPQSLLNLYNSKDEKIEKKAKSIVRDLRNQFRDRDFSIELGSFNSLKQFSENYNLKYETEPGLWESIKLGKTDIESIYSIFEKLKNESEGRKQVIFPYHDYSVIGYILAFFSIYTIINPNIQVAIYSPGTSGRWGTKKDIRNLYRKYSIDTSERKSVSVIPLYNIVPLSRVKQNKIYVENQSTNIIDNPPSIVILKSWDSFNSLEENIDILLHNYIPDITGKDAYNLLKIEESFENNKSKSSSFTNNSQYKKKSELKTLSLKSFDDDSVNYKKMKKSTFHLEFYSIFTEQIKKGFTQTIGPPTDLSSVLFPNDSVNCPYEHILEQESKLKSEDTIPSESAKHSKHARSFFNFKPKIICNSVETNSNIIDALTELRSYADKLDDDLNKETIRNIYNIKYKIESLPVPVSFHDNWISNQLTEGNYNVPNTFSERKAEIDKSLEESELKAETIENSINTIENIYKILEDTNPLFEGLVNILDEAVSNGETVAILCSKKTYKDMLNKYFSEYLDTDWQTIADISFVDKDSIRTLDSVDRLIVFGILPPQTAIYYHHPGVDKINIITYDEGWSLKRIQGILERRKSLLPYYLNLSLPDINIIKEETKGKRYNKIESQKSKDHELSFSDELYSTYYTLDTKDKSSRTSPESPDRYTIEFSDGTSIDYHDTHPVIVRSEQELVSKGEFLLRRLSGCNEGNEIVIIDEDIHEDLWEDFLRGHYENTEEDFETFIKSIDIWYNTIENALKSESGNRPWINLGKKLKDAGIQENKGTIYNWLHSVYKANNSIDLILKSELRIGPRNEEAVEIIAEEYGNKKIKQHWDKVHRSMRSIRKVHREKGHVFWENMARKASKGDLLNYPNVKIRKIDNIKRISN